MREKDYDYLARMMIQGMDTNQEKKDAMMNLITSPLFTSMRLNWKYVYSWCIGHKVFQPIENLEPDEKKELWIMTCEICKNYNYNKEQLIELAKIFYTLEYYLNTNQI